MNFTAQILQEGKTATGIPVPPEVLAALDGGKKPAVTVTINGASYRTTVGYMGGQAMLPLSAENRAVTGAEGGDTVDVGLTLDTASREVAIPEDFAAAMAARAVYDKLAPSARKAHVVNIEGAKAAETRLRRIEKAVASLTAGT